MRRTEFIQMYCIHATFIGVVEGLKGKEENMGNADTRVKVAISQANALEALGVFFDPESARARVDINAAGEVIHFNEVLADAVKKALLTPPVAEEEHP